MRTFKEFLAEEENKINEDSGSFGSGSKKVNYNLPSKKGSLILNQGGAGSQSHTIIISKAIAQEMIDLLKKI